VVPTCCPSFYWDLPPLLLFSSCYRCFVVNGLPPAERPLLGFLWTQPHPAFLPLSRSFFLSPPALCRQFHVFTSSRVVILGLEVLLCPHSPLFSAFIYIFFSQLSPRVLSSLFWLLPPGFFYPRLAQEFSAPGIILSVLLLLSSGQFLSFLPSITWVLRHWGRKTIFHWSDVSYTSSTPICTVLKVLFLDTV